MMENPKKKIYIGMGMYVFLIFAFIVASKIYFGQSLNEKQSRSNNVVSVQEEKQCSDNVASIQEDKQLTEKKIETFDDAEKEFEKIAAQSPSEVKPIINLFSIFFKYGTLIVLIGMAIPLLFWLKKRLKNKNKDINDSIPDNLMKPDNIRGKINIKEGLEELIIIIPKTSWDKNGQQNVSGIIGTMFFVVFIIVAAVVSLSPNGVMIDELSKDPNFNPVRSFAIWYSFIGLIFFILMAGFLFWYTLYQFAGFDKININKIKNTVTYSMNFPLKSLIPRFIYEKKADISKVSVFLTEPVKILNNLTILKTDLYLVFKKSNSKEDKVEIAGDYNIEDKENIYKSIKKYI